MAHFGIWVDKDSFFVGTSPRRWFGIHLDVPWTDCCRYYYAPYRAYVHYGWGCWTIDLPIPDRREDPLTTPFTGRTGKVTRRKVTRRCFVEGCTAVDDELFDGYATLKYKLRSFSGAEDPGGSSMARLCRAHAEDFEQGRLRIKWHPPHAPTVLLP